MHPLDIQVESALAVPFLTTQKGYIIAGNDVSDKLMTQLRREFYDFTHPDGHLNINRLVQLEAMGYQHKPIVSPAGGLIGYAVELKGRGWLSYQ